MYLTRAPKYKKPKMTELQEETDKHTTLVWYSTSFSQLLEHVDKSRYGCRRP